jgi:hypothetical protein
MDNTYTSMMSGIPAALGIWLGLIGVSVVAFALLAAIAGRGRRSAERSRPGPVNDGYSSPNAAMRRALAAAKAVTVDEAPAPAAREPRPGRPKANQSKAGRPRFTRPNAGRTESSRPDATRSDAGRPERKPPASRDAEATDVLPAVEAVETAEPPASDEERFAEELATAAARAGVTADKRQAEWETARRAIDSAWQAYEEAEVAAKRAIRAAAFPVPETPLTPAEFADRERYLHRAARAAQARGELSTDQLIDALSHRNGFDPRLHPFEQDALLRRLGRDRMLLAYRTAAERERVAWREADLAQAAQRSLDREAAAAARNVTRSPEPAGASRHIRVTTPVLSLR